MTVDIISVGTEILLGEIVNTNAVFIAEHIAALGFSSYSQKVVGDNAIRLKEALKASFACADLVILTGGLGPTEDDITKEVVAKVFNSKLIMHEETKHKIQLFFELLKMYILHLLMMISLFYLTLECPSYYRYEILYLYFLLNYLIYFHLYV